MLNNSSYKPHGTYVSGFIFLLHQEGPKKPQSIFSLSSRGWNSLAGACSDLDIGKLNLDLIEKVRPTSIIKCFVYFQSRNSEAGSTRTKMSKVNLAVSQIIAMAVVLAPHYINIQGPGPQLSVLKTALNKTNIFN